MTTRSRLGVGDRCMIMTFFYYDLTLFPIPPLLDDDMTLPLSLRVIIINDPATPFVCMCLFVVKRV
jgi:hypothetical protein